MIKVLVSVVFSGVLLFAGPLQAYAQKRKKGQGENDTLLVYRKFASLSETYRSLPLLMQVAVTRKLVFPGNNSDSTSSQMTLYYGEHDFYMKGEGMEQLATDSLIVLVDNSAKMIRLFPGTGSLRSSLEKSLSMLLPDSSLLQLAAAYKGKTVAQGGGSGLIELNSRERLKSSGLPKSSIAVIFSESQNQMLHYTEIKRSLVPVDAEIYKMLKQDSNTVGKLFDIVSDSSHLYFVHKEEVTTCNFLKMDHSPRQSPVRQGDRIVKNAAGEYIPAKNYEDYMLSKEF